MNSPEEFIAGESGVPKRTTDKNSRRRRTTYNPPDEYTSTHYEPLPKTRSSIRILVLYASSPDNPDIQCELIIPKDYPTNPKGDEPKGYEALSWCWGSDEKTEYISIRKDQEIYAKYVSPNLFLALHALRHHQHHRYLWIDAICIDQDDLDEKNHQVEMMGKIYGNAERVCIWLGDATESSRIALRFIKHEVLQLQNFDELCGSREATSKWGALLQLMQRPWFSRRWVVQEIALARKAVIYCGMDRISWNKFAIAVELFVEVETATHRLSEVMKKDPKYYHVPGWFEYVSALGASLLVDATGRLFRDYKEDNLLHDAQLEDESDISIGSDSDSGSDEGSDSSVLVKKPDPMFKAMRYRRPRTASIREGQRHPLLSLEYLVSSLSIFDTTVPHDTIYALLAIGKDTTPIAAGSDQQSDHAQHALEIFTQRKRYNVDYKLPYIDICKVFIQFCVERSLQVDRSRALDVICRPWATEEKVLNRIRSEAKKAKKAKETQERQQKSLDIRRRQRNPRVSDAEGSSMGSSMETSGYENLTDHAPGKVTPGTKRQARKGSHNSSVRSEEEEEESKDMPLPSWIPQLSKAPHAMYPQAGIAGIKMSRKNADPLVGLPRTTQGSYTAAETKGIDMKTLKFRKRANMGHFSMYVKGFVLDKIAKVEEVSRNGQIPQRWADLGGWQGARGHPPDRFWRTLVADRGRDQKNSPVYYARACKESFTKGGYVGGAVNTTDLINYERNSVVAEFCRRVQAVIWNRALVTTESGGLGLVGENVQPGDLVCILYGCSVPVILSCNGPKDETDFQDEMEWELKFLANTLGRYYKQYWQRAQNHKHRKENDKKKYARWERQKWKLWLRDQEWRREWQKRLEAEQKSERNEGLAIKRQYDLEEVEKLTPTTLDYRRHLKHLIWNMDLRVGREFNKWKREKAKVGKDWGPGVVNWKKFELRLKYGRKWKRFVKIQKEKIRKEIEEEFGKRMLHRNRKAHQGNLTLVPLPDDNSSPLKGAKDIIDGSVGPKDGGESGSTSGNAKKGKGKASTPPPLPPKSRAMQTLRDVVLEEQSGKKKMLSEKEMKIYNSKIRENFRKRLGEDGYYHYLLRGECYIHGMMDGKAMETQNEKPIPTTIFELR